MSGQDIKFHVNSQPSAAYLAVPLQPDAPGVIVLHAWWGLNPFFKGLCDQLASEGFVAFAPDLNNGKVARTVDEAEKLLSEVGSEQKQAIVGAWLSSRCLKQASQCWRSGRIVRTRIFAG